MDEQCLTHHIVLEKLVKLSNTDCGFGYRTSIFNTSAKGRYVILEIEFSLNKRSSPNLSYGDVKKYFVLQSIANPSLTQIRQAIIEIRNLKFPFPVNNKNGNAGSFFKAPVLTPGQFEGMIKKLSANLGPVIGTKVNSMRAQLTVAQGFKVPYGYLIEACGLKGKQVGGASVCETHAGVILNSSGQATATDVLSLYKLVKQTVYEKTGVTLSREPELVGFLTQDLAA